MPNPSDELLRECPVHPTCALVGNTCPVGECWYDIDGDARQVLRLQLIFGTTAADTELVSLGKDDLNAYIFQIAENAERQGCSQVDFLSRGDSLKAIVSLYKERLRARKPLPGLTVRAADRDRFADSFLKDPAWPRSLDLERDEGGRLWIRRHGVRLIHVPTPEEEAQILMDASS